MMETLLKSFEAPDEVRNFPNGRFEIVRLGELTKTGQRFLRSFEDETSSAFGPHARVPVVKQGLSASP